MHTFFALSLLWKTYDVFSRQKISTFRSSRPAVLELAARYKSLIKQLEGDRTPAKDDEEREQADQIIFMEMCEICLWGNATDLSLLTSLTYEDVQKLQGAEARKKAEKNILANDLPAAYKVLTEAKKKDPKSERRVDIVLDNAGFELYVDLILAGYLLAAGLATQVSCPSKLQFHAPIKALMCQLPGCTPPKIHPMVCFRRPPGGFCSALERAFRSRTLLLLAR